MLARTTALAARAVRRCLDISDHNDERRSFFLPNLNADMTQLLSATARFATFAKTKMENDDAA